MKDAMTETGMTASVPAEIAKRLKAPCTSCFWFCRYKTEKDIEARCAHPEHGGTPDPVYGRMEATASAYDMRAEAGACGPQARLLTPLTSLMGR